MNTSRLAHLRVTRNHVTIRSIQHRLGQCVHALIMKRPTHMSRSLWGTLLVVNETIPANTLLPGDEVNYANCVRLCRPNVCGVGNSSHRLSPRANLRSEKPIHLQFTFADTSMTERESSALTYCEEDASEFAF